MGNFELALIKGNFSFTFTIPSFKNVYYKGNNIPYGKLTNCQQYDFLEKILHKHNKFDNIKWIYENHGENDNRLHIHGFIKDAFEDMVYQFRNDFYSHPIKVAYKSFVKFSDIQKTKLDICFFEKYMEKNQDKIKYFMGEDEDKKKSDELDGKVNKPVFIEVNNTSPQYINSLSEHLESENLGDEYRFGKKDKKFIVEI